MSEGINLPLASLHSKQSCGIGEFYDLIPLIDWCAELGMNIIQLLPLNDSGTDPSPYSALSSCALHPLYLSLLSLPYLDEHPHLRKKLAPLHALTKSPRIDYNRVLTHKLQWLRLYVDEVGHKIRHLTSYTHFTKQQHWLRPYALFKTLKDRFEQTPWTTWPKESCPSIDPFWEVLQFLTFQQLTYVHSYAKEKNIQLKGDIPILINMESADVFCHPHLFNFSLRAGAPPDQYNPDGQYWGFPLFRWEEMKKENFHWWKERLHYATNFYDLFRIDHVIGFFRIWAVAPTQSAKEGKYLPEATAEWLPQGMLHLQMVQKASSMIPIAEDLGTIEPEMRSCMNALGIAGTKVMRWERAWGADGHFLPLHSYPALSMTTLSTHDSETLALWWQNAAHEAQVLAKEKGWSYQSALTYGQRKELLKDSHRTTSLYHINLLQEYLALYPELVSERIDEERINIPGKILPTNWTYRFRPSVETLTSHEGLKKDLQEILSTAFRPAPG